MASSNGEADSISPACGGGGGNDNRKYRQGLCNLYDACQQGDLESVRYFVDMKGAIKNDIHLMSEDGETPLHYACRFNKLDIVKYLVENTNVKVEALSHIHGSALHEASQYNCLSVTRYLIEQAGVNIHILNRKRETVLYAACRGRAMSMVEYYVECGILDINASSSSGGWTALHCASARGYFDIVQCLVRRVSYDGGSAIDTEVKDGCGRTALHLAIAFNCIRTVQSLLECGNANVEASDRKGRTPLILACYHGFPEMVCFLMDRASANMKVVDNAGRTPLEVASSHRPCFRSVLVLVSHLPASWPTGVMTGASIGADPAVNGNKTTALPSALNECTPPCFVVLGSRWVLAQFDNTAFLRWFRGLRRGSILEAPTE